MEKQESKKPIIQIIIPVYNASATLKKCLDSVIAQTFSGWQALLIDDCSTDNSRDIMTSYEKRDSRFCCIFHEKNLGVSETRNHALKLISSPYTAFLDSDDWWEPEMLEKLWAGAVEHRADIVQCRFIYDYENGSQVLPTGAFGKETFLRRKDFKPIYIKMMTGINMNHVCMKLIRSELFYGMSFDATLKTAEDLEFSIQLFKKAETYLFLPDILYHYYRGGGSLTGAGLSKKEKLAANRRIACELRKSLPDWGMDRIYYRLLAKSRTYLIIVSKLFRTVREKLVTRL